MDLQLLNTGKSLNGDVEAVKKEANSISKMEVLSAFSYSPLFFSNFFSNW